MLYEVITIDGGICKPLAHGTEDTSRHFLTLLSKHYKKNQIPNFTVDISEDGTIEFSLLKIKSANDQFLTDTYKKEWFADVLFLTLMPDNLVKADVFFSTIDLAKSYTFRLKSDLQSELLDLINHF